MSAPTAALDRELQELVTDLCERHQVPGAAVGVRIDGREVVVCHGVTSVDDPLPVTDETLFFIGSTSKTVTATALVALVEAGRLSFDDRVTEHLPGLALPDPDALERLTVGHLLDHTAGWVGDVTTDQHGPDALAAAVTEIAAAAEQVTPPGEVMSYNNAAFIMAGRLLEVLTGESYDAAVRRLVLDPLELRNTWSTAAEVAQRRLAVGHAAKDGEMVVLPDWPIDRAILPAGGLISSVRDQLRYGRFHLEGGPVLPDQARLAMQERRVEVRSSITGVGISWLLNRFGSTELFQLGKFLGVVFLFIGFLVSIEAFREIRVPFTGIRFATRRREAPEAVAIAERENRAAGTAHDGTGSPATRPAAPR